MLYDERGLLGPSLSHVAKTSSRSGDAVTSIPVSVTGLLEELSDLLKPQQAWIHRWICHCTWTGPVLWLEALEAPKHAPSPTQFHSGMPLRRRYAGQRQSNIAGACEHRCAEKEGGRELRTTARKGSKRLSHYDTLLLCCMPGFVAFQHARPLMLQVLLGQAASMSVTRVQDPSSRSLPFSALLLGEATHGLNKPRHHAASTLSARRGNSYVATRNCCAQQSP